MLSKYFNLLQKELTIMARKSVSRREEIVEESKKGMKIWMGVDVHKESYTVAILRHCKKITCNY
jgi:hypothetical protein